MVKAFNPSTQKTEASKSLCIWGQPGLLSEFQESQGYIMKCCLRFRGQKMYSHASKNVFRALSTTAATIPGSLPLECCVTAQIESHGLPLCVCGDGGRSEKPPYASQVPVIYLFFYFNLFETGSFTGLARLASL